MTSYFFFYFNLINSYFNRITVRSLINCVLGSSRVKALSSARVRLRAQPAESRQLARVSILSPQTMTRAHLGYIFPRCYQLPRCLQATSVSGSYSQISGQIEPAGHFWLLGASSSLGLQLVWAGQPIGRLALLADAIISKALDTVNSRQTAVRTSSCLPA